MALNIFIVFISLIGLIILHEFGHFIIAKKCGVKVEEFGVFLPPRLFGKKIGETVYSINLIPLGAFVKVYGEEGGIEEANSFTGKPIWQRILIVLGGVISFWLIAVILLSVVMGLGTRVAVEDGVSQGLIDPQVQITLVAPGSPAEKAGIRAGDAIKKFSISNLQFSINDVRELQELTEQYKGQEVTLTIQRGKEVFETSLVPRVSPPEGEGAMGVGLAKTAIQSYPWYLAPIKGIEACFNLTRATLAAIFQVLGNLIQGEPLPPGSQLTGPVGIGSMMVQFVQLGTSYYLYFVALISIGLGITNLLPIPALDGGKFVFLLIEAIRKKPINQKIEQNITAVCFALLLALMVWVTIQDITRLF